MGQRRSRTQTRPKASRLTSCVIACSFFGTQAGASVLTWNANTESDLAGYKVYHCGHQPCTKSSAHAKVLVTLGKVTTVEIGTPAAVTHYTVTAYDSLGNESSESNVVTFVPSWITVPPAQTNVRVDSLR